MLAIYKSHAKENRCVIGILNVLITLLLHQEPVTKLPRSDWKVFLNPSMPLLPNCGCQWIRKMFGKDRWIWRLAHLICVSVFIFQSSKLLSPFFTPTMNNREVQNVPLKDIDFPLEIKIFVKPF